MQKLKLNIIPLNHPNQDLGFYKEEIKGYYSLWKDEYPISFWNDFNEESNHHKTNNE